MSAQALLEENPKPERNEIVKAISGNLCRCTGYQNIITGIEDAAERCRRSRKILKK
jgi:carbon-monoxide dehydrogenase small subunit